MAVCFPAAAPTRLTPPDSRDNILVCMGIGQLLLVLLPVPLIERQVLFTVGVTTKAAILAVFTWIYHYSSINDDQQSRHI